MNNGFMRLFHNLASPFVQQSTDPVKAAASQIDTMVAAGQLPSQAILEKSNDAGSKLTVRDNDTYLAYITAFNSLAAWHQRVYVHGTDLPQDPNNPARDYYLAEVWKQEPIMAGAVYSMTAKMTALKWSVTGRRLQAKRWARILAEAAYMGDYGWDGFQAGTAQDFYTTNRGVFWETPRPNMFAPMDGIGHVDALCCTLTGNVNNPMVYASTTTGQIANFQTGEYIHFSSMTSPREYRLGAGFCAVDRALRAIHLLIGLHDYDDEKLNNLPPEGVATVTGLTMDEFRDAMTLWLTQRKQDKSLTFPQVLWLIGSQPNVDVKVGMVPFSTLPESFNRQTVVDQYVSTLAMCFGVDTREFWPVSSGALGTASESEIQHLKAKGKGSGEYISMTERHINSELDEESQFAYDTQDIEEDQTAATIAKAWIDAYYPLYTGQPAGKSKASQGGKPNTEMIPNREEIPGKGAANQAMAAAGPAQAPGQAGPGQVEQVITKDELKRLLADKGVIPEWMLDDGRFRVEDSSIHLSKEGHPDDFTMIKWDGRYLKECRLPAYVLRSRLGIADDLEQASRNSIHIGDVPTALKLKGASEVWAWIERLKEAVLERNIKGKPISMAEVERGTGITANTIRDELERWKKDPTLSKYVPNQEELDALMESVE